MYQPINFDSYQKQANDLVSKINQLQQYPPVLQPVTAPIPVIPPHIDYVKGIDGAKEFLAKMPANGNAVLMDYDNAIFYVVSKDANGNAAPVAYAHFTLETEKAPEEPVYVTKADFDQFKDELKKMLEQKGAKA